MSLIEVVIIYDSPMSLDHLFRPEFHFAPAKNWMNDPNGLVWHKGEYHLFFQHNPHGTKWGHMSWGHAVSTDLLNWTELPVAIAEAEDGMIFSGSAVSDGNELVAIYTRHTETNQAQCIARSTDNGRTFSKYECNPVLDEGKQNFRDPKVFRYLDHWIMCVAQPDDRQISFYKSMDLISWTHLSNFGPAGAVHGIWECPDLFPLQFEGQEVWVLLVSLNPGGLYGSGTQYFVGDFDGQTFSPRYSTAEPGWLDFGKDNYAGVTFNNEPDGRRIFIGWMANWEDVKDHPETSWTCQMTIPRELSLVQYQGEITLAQHPICKPTYEINKMAPKSGVIGLTGFAKIGYNADKNVIFVNEYEAPYEPTGERIVLTVVIDRASVELFTGDGVRTISLALFPAEGIPRDFTHSD